MCLPAKNDQSSSSAAPATGSTLGIGALMLLACLAGPALAGGLTTAGGVILALCVAVPATAPVWRRNAARRRATAER